MSAIGAIAVITYELSGASSAHFPRHMRKLE